MSQSTATTTAAVLLLAVAFAGLVHAVRPAHMLHRRSVASTAAPAPAAAGHEPHKSMMHNHLSRKVFDRACAASKDTIDEIIACLTGNEHLSKAIKKEDAFACHKDAFGIDFDPNDLMKHKEMICKNREKFEQMTTCIYRKTAEVSDVKEIEKMTEAMVDVGLCIINALDG